MRNSKKYFYVNNVGLEVGSETLELFLADMKRHHMSDTPGKFMASKITDYYDLLKKIEHGGVIPMVVSGSSSNNNHITQSNGHSEATRALVDQGEEDTQQSTTTPFERDSNDNDDRDEADKFWDM